MTKKQRRAHKLGNALRAERGGQLYTLPNPSWRVKARIIRWSQAVEFHDGANQ